MNGSPGAKEALMHIRYLSQPERTIRQRYAKPRMERFHGWLTQTEAASAPSGGLHKAAMHALKWWPSLLTYPDDGRIPVDNNRSERRMRPVAQGRRNGLSAGSLRAGERMAGLLSLVETARMNGMTA